MIKLTNIQASIIYEALVFYSNQGNWSGLSKRTCRNMINNVDFHYKENGIKFGGRHAMDAKAQFEKALMQTKKEHGKNYILARGNYGNRSILSKKTICDNATKKEILNCPRV